MPETSTFFSRLLRFGPLFLVLLDQAVVSGTRLVMQIMVGYGSPDQLGLFGIAMGVVLVFLSFQEALVTTPYTVFAPRKESGSKAAFAAGSFWSQLLVMAVAVTVWGCLLLPRFFGEQAPGSTTTILLAVLWYAPAHLLREYARRYLLALGKPPAVLGLDVLASVAVLAWPGVLWWQGVLSAHQAFLIVTVANLLYISLWWWQYRKDFALAQTSPQNFLGLSWTYGRWIVGENLCSALMMAWMGWHLARVSGEHQAGLFQACVTVVLLANPFLLGFASYFGPHAAEVYHLHGRRALLQLTNRSLLFVLVVLAALATALWPLGEWLLTLFFGDKYAGNGHLVGLLSLAMIGLGISHVLAVALQTAGRPRINFLAGFVSCATIVGVASLLVGTSLQRAASGFVVAVFAGVLIRAAGFWMSGEAERPDHQDQAVT